MRAIVRVASALTSATSREKHLSHLSLTEPGCRRGATIGRVVIVGDDKLFDGAALARQARGLKLPLRIVIITANLGPSCGCGACAPRPATS